MRLVRRRGRGPGILPGRCGGRSRAARRRSAPCTATPSPGCCATCRPWSARTPRTSPPKPGCTSPATWPASPATTTASAAGSPPSPGTAPWTTCAAPPAADDTAGGALEAVATRAAIALIATLPPDQAEAVLLRAVLGLDAATAGTVLGKRPGAVRTAAHRGLRTLARRLRQQQATPGRDRDRTSAVTSRRELTLKDMR